MKTSKSGSGPGGKKNTSASRSRSASVMPGGSVGPEGDAQADKQDEDDSDAANDDDKLYCVCKTKYDEDKFMIACDRCDEWYHTQCVNLPELEVDLIDQFICPPCIDKNPHLSLKTTYKPRCLYGLKQPDPSSPKACHKPARGAFSKYCSDECGVKYMESRIEAYAKKGGKKDKLWESVKNAEKREGVVVCAENALNGHIKMDVDVPKDGDVKPLSSKRSKVARETDRLKGSLEQIVKRREELKKGMEIVIWREKLLELASERAQQLGLCGWDHRLCFSDEELADYGAGVLESYEEIKLDGVKEENGDMQIDGAVENQGEWWCPGNVSCGRHVGWQLTRYKDVCKEKEKKEEALMKLTTREREIRKHIEDIVDPHGRNTNEASPQSPLKPANTKLSNGHSKVKLGDGVKKGKKRKAPAS
ncbi:hypothetical protein BDQ17DRAFT_25781 [Cyathus striatus]|nr:hypothetical protein BDQ17DRAFT_25781 [Cyathus striatus]